MMKSGLESLSHSESHARSLHIMRPFSSLWAEGLVQSGMGQADHCGIGKLIITGTYSLVRLYSPQKA